MQLPPQLADICATFPHPLVFATVSGAHLYGFPSPDSDFDLRGCHVLPIRSVLGINEPAETEERMDDDSGLELDLVSHDVKKFCKLLLKPNGYVLEQLLSPLVVRTTDTHKELVRLAPQVITRHHAHHYLGFARSQWRLFEQQPRVKTLLYVYRVLLTGIHLMQTGEVESNLPRLLEHLPQPGVEDLLAAKIAGAEKQGLPESEVTRHTSAYEQLLARLEAARDSSSLPEHATAHAALQDLVVEARLETLRR